jgi:hypothetical protein
METEGARDRNMERERGGIAVTEKEYSLKLIKREMNIDKV